MVKVHVLDTGRVKIHRRQVDPHPRDGCACRRRWSTGGGPTGFRFGALRSSTRRAWWSSTPGRPPTSRRRGGTSSCVRCASTSPTRIAWRHSLREAGLDPGAVRHHVFTHLHVDHVGAGPLPGARVVLDAPEWRAATAQGARLRGYMRPGIHDPQTIAGDHDLYGDGGVRLLATPGHTAGHQSVLVDARRGSAAVDHGGCRLQRGGTDQSHHRRGRGFPRRAPGRASTGCGELCRGADGRRADARHPATQRVADGKATLV